MKRSKSIALCIAGGLVAVGLVVMILAVVFSKGDTDIINITQYTEVTCTVTEKFDNISISASSENVSVLRSDNDEVTLITYETDKIKYTATVENNRLIINKSDTRKWYEKIGISFGAQIITLYLPQDIYGTLEAVGTSGRISISDNAFESVIIKNTSGGIELCSVNSTGTILVYNTSGKIKAEDCTTSGIFTAQATSGKIDLSDINAEYGIQLKTNSGAVKIEASYTNKDMEIKTTSGRIYIDSTVADGKASLESTSGSIEFEKFDAGSLFLKSTSGIIQGTLLSDKNFVTSTSSGNVNVPMSVDEAGRCECKTTSGNIRIKIAE